MMSDWNFVLITLLILDEDVDEGRQNWVHSRYRKEFFKSLGIEQRRRRHRKIPQCCLQDPSNSAWHKLYDSHNDQGMITLTGFDCMSFASLCEMFAPIFDSYTTFVPSGTSCFEWRKLENRGRKRKIRPEWSCAGMDLDKGIVNGIAAYFWDDLLQP